MMIKPPRQSRGGTILEVNDRILVTVEQFLLYELLVRLVGEARVANLGRTVDLIDKEARKNGSGSKAVKAMIVMQDPEFHPVRTGLLFSE